MRRSDALPVCRGQRIPDVRDAVTSDDADQASAAALTASFAARATKTLSSKRTIRRDQPSRVEGMSDITTAYLVSLGIIGAGAIWIDAGDDTLHRHRRSDHCCWIDRSLAELHN